MRCSWFGGGLVLLTLLGSPHALADGGGGPSATRSQCAADSETAQDLRASGKLIESEVAFRACTASTCPRAVREDCVQQLEEVRRAIATLILVITDDKGRVAPSFRVTIDGQAPGARQEGAIFRVDPGEHTFQVTADGYAPATTTLTLSAGVKGREERVVLSPLAQATPTPSPRSLAEASTPASSSQRTIAFVVTGAGILGLGAGAVLGLLANDAHDAAMEACPNFRCADPRVGIDREETAAARGDAATVAVAVGAALVIGGLTLLFTAPKTPARTTGQLR